MGVGDVLSLPWPFLNKSQGTDDHIGGQIKTSVRFLIASKAEIVPISFPVVKKREAGPKEYNWILWDSSIIAIVLRTGVGIVPASSRSSVQTCLKMQTHYYLQYGTA